MEGKMNFRYEVPFTMIDSALLLSEELTTYQKAIYCILCAYASNTDKSCYPSYNTIAKKTGCSRKKAIDTISELVRLGYIEKQEQTNAKGENVSNIYYIHTYPKKPVENSAVGGVQDTPGSVPHIPRGIPRTPELYINNYNHMNYNQSIGELEGILEDCGIDGLKKEKDRDLFRQVITVMYHSKEITVCGNTYPQAVVHENMRKLSYEVVASTFDTLKALDAPPKSPINYLISVIYRGIFEVESSG